MFKRRTSFKDIILGIKNAAFSSDSNQSHNFIKLDKVLVLSKLSRYEFEKHKYNVDDTQLEKVLRSRGTDFEKLMDCHVSHKKFEKIVVDTFRQLGSQVKVVNRFKYSDEIVQWADAIVPTGGDGTFLLASSRVRDSSKPVVGFNSDPTRSEGHLCLPKKYSVNVKTAAEKLSKGEFDWLLRSRIRIKLISQKGQVVPKCMYALYDNESEFISKYDPLRDKVLPVLALNEVFVGEQRSSRVSHLQMRLNGSSEQTSIKCSGVCVCTGTGSTSWHLSINRIPIQSIAGLLKYVDIQEDKEALASNLADIYNKHLIFKPEDNRMCYTIRDLISAGVWPNPKGIKHREFVSKLEIKSNCYEATLVVDGGVSFDFNDGTIAFLEIRPEDALKTVILCD